MNHNQNWPRIANHLDGILITVGSGFGKTNGLLNLSKHQQADLNKLYLHVNDPFESKYQLLIDEREKVGIKHKKTPEAFIDYSQRNDHVYYHLEDYDPTKERYC